jgi:hypothetical protein
VLVPGQRGFSSGISLDAKLDDEPVSMTTLNSDGPGLSFAALCHRVGEPQSTERIGIGHFLNIGSTEMSFAAGIRCAHTVHCPNRLVMPIVPAFFDATDAASKKRRCRARQTL